MGWKTVQKFVESKSSMLWRIRIFLWYYRILHTTFGGVSLDSNSQLTVNKFWKVYGIIFGIGSAIWNCSTIYLFQWSPIMIALYNSGFVTNYYLCLILKGVVDIRCVFLFWFLQFRGIEFFRTFFVYRIDKSKTLINLFFVWILHIIVPIVIGIIQLYHLKKQSSGNQQSNSLYRVFFILLQNFLNFSVSWSLSFLMWNISICGFENLKKIETNLKKLIRHKTDKVHPLMHLQKFNHMMNQRDILSKSKIMFFDIKRQIQGLDRAISWATVVDTSVTILVIMIQIYALAQNSPILGQYSTLIGFTFSYEIIKLIINCWVNGLIYEQTDRIMALLDDIDPNDLDEYTYREWMAFRTMSRDIRFGFTVGGLAPFRKSTLLAIFSFMMNYTVILIQTAKYM